MDKNPESGFYNLQEILKKFSNKNPNIILFSEPFTKSQFLNEIIDLIRFQLKDNCKARIIDTKQKNNYVRTKSTKKIQAQLATYHYLKNKNT